MRRPLFLAYGPNPFAPEGHRWAAAMIGEGPGAHWMATGPSEEAALAKLHAMWERQYPTRDKRKGPRKPTSEPVAETVHVADDDVVI